MRLKSIKLAGFKSFVDPTTVNFPSNLGAVVGPNGCGKSNIIDAVRWVMGESSAKNLRGEAMTDVIFNGSSGRKPVGQASIELIFDNSDGTITGEYAGFNEISVKRKVTRDSQNFYYLNGSKCRRRDITDIFLGTGLGPRSYAIIEQGMISRLIEAKPEELRVYIEEAAGISKYKERRRDTENRMNRTRENLERLTDIREELERQLSRLERQSQAAEKYTEFKKQERQLKSHLQAVRYLEMEQKANAKQDAIKQLELAVEAGVTEQVHYDTAIEKHRTEYTDLGDKFSEVQGRFYAVGADIARIEQSIQHAQERERQLKVDLEQTERDCQEAEEHLAADSAKTEGWEAELLEIEPDLEVIREAEENSGTDLLAAEEAMHVWQQEWDQFNQRAAEPRQQAEVQQSRIKYLEQVQQRIMQRMEKLESERDSLVVGDAKDEIEMLEEELATLELSIEEKSEQTEQHSDTIRDLRDKQQSAADQRDAMRSELQSSKGRLASLEALQQAAMGNSSKALGQWLEAQGLQDYPRLAEKITVAGGWEKAVEVVLGPSLQAICSDKSLSDISPALAELEAGQVTLIDSMSRSSASAASESLLSKVTSDIDLSGLLANVKVADDLPAAMAMRSTLSAQESIVTKDGLLLGPNWIKVIKDEDANSGVLARQQELETLTETIAQLEEKIDLVTDELETAKLALQDAERELETARKELDEMRRRHSEVRSQVSGKRAKVEQVLDGRQRAERDLEEAKTQLNTEGENLVDARAKLHAAISSMEDDTSERERLLSQRDEIRSNLDNARQRARHDKDKAHATAMRFQSVKTQLESVRQGIQRLKDQMQRMQERKETLSQALEECLDPVEENKLELEALLEKRVSVEQQLTEARAAMETAEASLREAEQKRHQVEQQLVGIRGNLESARLEAQTLTVQRQGLKQQLADDDLDIDAVAQDLDEDINPAELEEEITKVGNRISRLGPINLAAIDEFKTESERKTYLDSQNEDLQEALETLEGAIKRIDRETRTRFKETFDQVNSGFQELFPKVFGGGHAYLELTGEDLLDTGVAIMARPPGKKNSTIHLLSGGEKALTAIALVFSIFRLNPAPFCMLDEVDAPLDDANVGRYARMVEEMSSQVQFIYITHNKIAMEMAHQLLGVTMHEPGVSRMVTVDVDEAAELAAS
ncbi:Chromosome partition protein Smc [Thalassocella blandensis]|nr:Chromosome partition protein Smc [Thalassocella blandensis]